MAEETPSAAEATTNTNGTDSNKKQRPPRDETPIEELYDLSQPIPRVRCISLIYPMDKQQSSHI